MNTDIRETGRITDATMWMTISAWIIAQIVYVLTFMDIGQGSDAHVYLTFAARHADENTWYPTPDEVWNIKSHTYIFYPGYINLLIILIKVFHTYKAIFWVNISLNCVLLWSLHRLLLYFGGKNTAKAGCILFCLTLWTAQQAAVSLTELPFMALCFLSLALLTYKSTRAAAGAGLLIILSNYIRPLGTVYMLTAILYMLAIRAGYRRITAYVAGAALMCGTILAVNHSLSDGAWFVSSNTLGVNMLMGSSDKATGGYCIEAISTPETDSLLQLRKPVFFYDSVFRSKSIEYITDKPLDWLSVLPAKMKYQYVPYHHFDMGRPETAGLNDPDNGLPGPAMIFLLGEPLFIHCAVSVLFFMGLYYRRRQLAGPLCIVLLPLLAEFALLALTVGADRYHYPFYPVVLLFASFGAYGLARRLKQSHCFKTTIQPQ